MRNVLLVIRHEIASALGKRSFWVITFLLPLLIIGLNLGMQMLGQRAFQRTSSNADQEAQLGYVDEARLLGDLDGSPRQDLIAFDSRQEAQQALLAGQVGRYYVLPADYIASGELILVESVFAPFSGLANQDVRFETLVLSSLLADEELVALLMAPIAEQELRALAPRSEDPEPASPLSFWVSYATMFLFFFSLTQSSGLMLTSVSKEKETRTAEVLLLSLRARELMLGKVIGLGLVAALQLSIWATGGALTLGHAGGGPAAGHSLSRSFLGWLVLYFGLGYLVYASALAAVGVLAPSAREGAQFTFIVLLPLMIPLWLVSAFVEEPNGTLATVLSLFPLTAPLAMVTRLVSGSVPTWQPMVSLLGLAVTAYLFVLLAARLFRPDTLLSTTSLSLRRFLDELKSG
jgi:ABC-2 type transport system permease protein